MKCCEGECNQGRDCPWRVPDPDDRMPLSDKWSAVVVLAIIVIMWVLVALLVGVM